MPWAVVGHENALSLRKSALSGSTTVTYFVTNLLYHVVRPRKECRLGASLGARTFRIAVMGVSSGRRPSEDNLYTKKLQFSLFKMTFISIHFESRLVYFLQDIFQIFIVFLLCGAENDYIIKVALYTFKAL